MDRKHKASDASKEKRHDRQRNGKKGKKKFHAWPVKKKPEKPEATIEKLRSQYEEIEPSKINHFNDFPLSAPTKKGLRDGGYKQPTEIQRESIGLSLRGQDILGAAKTGSGKTLAFLIPILEILYCKQWTRLDGTGALIITPTRELAYQIFGTLSKIGAHHDFSAGLIIGGRDVKFEKERMGRINIIICTPGRLLQHMDENHFFDCLNLQVLVLDEADRILDLGFQKAMNSIIQNLPENRQTLLFSATQTKSVRDLARLSLKDPMYVSVHEHAAHSTPEALAQSYIECQLEDKLSTLYSFLKSHQKHKIIVFMSSCKQVRFMSEAFTKLRVGMSILALHGGLHQERRMTVYDEFCRKSRVALFATDIAARGLDFPTVNWVVQLDCPEDAETYIHRAGRTARLQQSGESLLILLPSEKDAMLKRLEDHKIPIKEIKVNPMKLQNPRAKLDALLAASVDLKQSAQRAFVAYIKSIFLMRDKEVFNVEALNTEAFSRSLGLAVPPKVRFLNRRQKEENDKKGKEKKKLLDSQVNKKQTSVSFNGESSDSSEDSDNSSVMSGSQDETKEPSTSQNDLKKHLPKKEQSRGFDIGDDDDSDEDILTIKRQNHELDNEIIPLTEEELKRPENTKKKKPLTKVAVAKKFLKKKIQLNKKVVFNDDGEVILDPNSQRMSALAREYESENVGGIDIDKAKAVMLEEDRFDKERFREKVRAKHREAKKKAKEQKEDVVEGLEQGEVSAEGEELENEEEVNDEFSSDESLPDLSWLPDPDKVYGEKGHDDDDDSEYNQHSDQDLSDKDGSGDSSHAEGNGVINPPLGLKRKFKKQGGQNKKKARPDKEESFASLHTGLSLQDDEELALKFLQAKR